MFRSICNKRHLPAAAAAGGLLTRTTLKCKSECEEVTAPCNDQNKGVGRRAFRVLIVGSGLTGCLTALRIRQRLRDCQPTSAKHLFDLTVVERATYPAGRFGATAAYRGCVADISAQVLSTINPKDPRALGGHGVTVEDIQTSSEIVQALASGGVISRVDDGKLGETEERMLWEGLWQHYSAPSGLRDVLLKLLSSATASPQFGVRVNSMTVSNDRTIHVKGVQRTSKIVDTNMEESTNNDLVEDKPFMESYDCVVLCIPAPNVLELGIAHYLSPMARHVLENVRYDRRSCEAHFFSKDLAPKLAKVFGQKMEIMLDEDEGDDDDDDQADSAIQYMSWQNPKRSKQEVPNNDDSAACCALAVHGQAGKLESLRKTLDSSLSKLTGLSEEDISSLRLYSKQIHWDVSQMITPMEAVVADPPRPAWQCIVGGKGSLEEGIIIAGDFMTQSSFVGCVATADAAARAVVERASSTECIRYDNL